MDRRMVLKAAVWLGTVGVGGPWRRAAAADEASPVASPVAEDDPALYGIEGLEWNVARSFDSDGITSSGAVVLHVGAAGMESEAAAAAGLPVVADGTMAELVEGFPGAAVVPVSTGDIGADEVIAYAGPIPIEGPIEEMLLALVMARDGTMLRMIALFSLIRPPLPLALEVYSGMRDRGVSDDPETVDGEGMHSGGIWGTLPTTADVPAGLVFEEDSEGYRSSDG